MSFFGISRLLPVNVGIRARIMNMAHFMSQRALNLARVAFDGVTDRRVLSAKLRKPA